MNRSPPGQRNGKMSVVLEKEQLKEQEGHALRLVTQVSSRALDVWPHLEGNGGSGAVRSARVQKVLAAHRGRWEVAPDETKQNRA